jgi:hypothetical protein
MRRRRRRRPAALLAAVGIAVTSLSLVVLTGSPASSTPAGTSSVVTKTVVATRTHLVGGKDVPVDTRTVTLTADVTTGLRDQQTIAVNWTGAHPSSNTSPDPNSDTGWQAEYPMVLLQCRGVDSTGAPAAQRISPQTCWSPFFGSRSQLNGAGTDSRDVDPGNFPAWRLDRYASAADRQRFAGEPATAKTGCPNLGNAAEHRLPFLAADGKVYYGAGNFADTACGVAPPEAASFTAGDTSASNLPDNATYAASDANGTGTASFNVRDDRTNASLGCSSTVACSLVAIPVMGISCDAGAGLPAADQPVDTPTDPTLVARAEGECEQKNFFSAGSLHVDNPGANYAVQGALWWSESNWRNRINIPLGFAPPSNVCDLVSKKVPVNVYGSELLIQATTQWSARFCLDANRDPFRHVQYSDTQARNLLTQALGRSGGSSADGTVEAIFDSYPPTSPYPRTVLHAPVAATAFALSYTIDDKSKHEYTQLKLTPRLLAKLLTESYPVRADLKQLYTYDAGYYGTQNPLKNNPLNITFDPEFIALNPGIESNSNVDTGARGALLSIGSNADAVRALTSYINADAEARSWLDGTPDPWGMVVNPNYRGIQLPVDTMPLLDTYAFPAGYGAEGTCTASIAPVPYLPLASAPIARMADIAQAVQYSVPGSQTRCSVGSDPNTGTSYYQWARAQRQSVGFRFVIGITSLADAKRYGLNTAALQTHSTADPTVKFSNASGRTFVPPSNASMGAAARLAGFIDDATGWPIPYDALSGANGVSAYPGTMFVYMDVAATGLPTADARAYSALLSYLAGPGQVPGSGSGQLPEGYLPLTAANGLGALSAYTAKAAQTLLQQNKPAGPVSVPGAVTGTTPTGTALPVAGSAPSAGGTPSGAAGPKSMAAPKASPRSAPALKSLGNTAGQSNNAATTVLILLIALLLLGPVVVPVSIIVLRRRGAR